jgi:hypothetical protein
MSHSDTNADAELFTALHRAIWQQPKPAARERRVATRRAYDCVQLAAAYDGETLPAPRDFAHVMCHDLSPSGFSYLADVRPQSRYLIVALGRAPFQFFVAQPVNQRWRESDGRRRLLIGCRFVRRLEA